MCKWDRWTAEKRSKTWNPSRNSNATLKCAIRHQKAFHDNSVSRHSDVKLNNKYLKPNIEFVFDPDSSLKEVRPSLVFANLILKNFSVKKKKYRKVKWGGALVRLWKLSHNRSVRLATKNMIRLQIETRLEIRPKFGHIMALCDEKVGYFWPPDFFPVSS